MSISYFLISLFHFQKILRSCANCSANCLFFFTEIFKFQHSFSYLNCDIILKHKYANTNYFQTMFKFLTDYVMAEKISSCRKFCGARLLNEKALAEQAKETEETLRQVLKQDPNDYKTMIELAKCLFHQKKYQESASYCKKILSSLVFVFDVYFVTSGPKIFAKKKKKKKKKLQTCISKIYGFCLTKHDDDSEKGVSNGSTHDSKQEEEMYNLAHEEDNANEEEGGEQQPLERDTQGGSEKKEIAANEHSNNNHRPKKFVPS
ncbi:hypothetical protein RFI_12487 [Reticulomyxa filosa]|uniref:Uncharacterized protein n=1 Tax=Reticulomyxa filosa TaxID=46433 RepID=X6NEB6_RETFI|nr:hypothetical protein RFI_12487 [Reticulomyxa filosa]|eukprot:ETO24670.1 hypothetical protein RFI_12487 [Reticulomyxa filosa]